ncbi:hypothetical protein AAFA46_04280 [Oscillospiraceae bacterium WX1]
MKVQIDRTTAGFSAEKIENNGKRSKVKEAEVKFSLQGKDEIELSGRKASVLNAASQSAKVSAPESLGIDMNAIRQKLATLNAYIVRNPEEALSAQGNIAADTVERLIG